MHAEVIKEGLLKIPLAEIKQPILWWTDPHFQPSKEEENSRVMDFIREAVSQIKPSLVINTGDIFHTKDKVYTSVLTQYEELLEDITKTSEVVQIVGNHDWGKLYSSHSLQRYRNMPKVTNVDEFLRLGDMAFMGYCRDKERFKRLMKSCMGARDLFGHFDINEFELGSGWEEVHAYADVGDFSNFRNVFSGHYHLAQEKFIKDTRFIYLGTPHTTTWGEADQHKRIGIIDGVSGKFYDLSTGMTFHKKLVVAPDEAIPIPPEEEVLRGVEYRLVLTGTKAQVNEKKKEVPAGFESMIAVDIKTEKTGRAEISLATNMEDAFKKYYFTKLSRDFKIDVTEENMKVVSENLKLDVEKLIELTLSYAARAQMEVS